MTARAERGMVVVVVEDPITKATEGKERCIMDDNEELPVGVLHNGGFYCLECDPSQGRGTAIYRLNVYPYAAACLECGEVCVTPRSDAWPDLFSRTERDVHRKCLIDALETFFQRRDPFVVCGCVVPGELARMICEHIREAHEYSVVDGLDHHED